MKRLLIMMSMLVACVGYARADEIVVPDVIIPKGGTATLDIQLNNEQVLSPGFGFYLRLPEGITVVDKSERLGERFDGTQVSMTCNYDETEGRYWIMAMIPPIASADVPIPGQSGTLVTLELQANEDLEENTILSGSIEDVEFRTWYEDKSGEDAELQFSGEFQITIGQPDDGRLKFYETSTSLPVYTAGGKANVTMFRTIRANQWSTICLPFQLTKAKAEAAFGSDVQLAEFTGFSTTYEDEDTPVPSSITITFTPYELKGTKPMKGGVPYLIKTSKDIESFEADDVTLFAAVNEVEKTDEYDTNGKFIGTLVKTVVPKDGLFVSDEKFYYSTGKTAIKAFRGWFELGAVLDKETDFGVKMFVGDIETRVDGLNVKDANGNIYDLSGRKVAKPQHGVYIINGRKIMK